MEDIDKYLIKSLITSPKNDKEIGFNTALITILKGIANGIPLVAQEAEFRNNEPQSNSDYTLSRLFVNAVRSIHPFSPDDSSRILSLISVSEIIDYKDFLLNGEKLRAVKDFKTAAGIGLKEAKDVIEKYHELIKNSL